MLTENVSMCVCSCWTPDRQYHVFCCMFITVQRIGQHSSPHMLEPRDVHKQHKSTWISIQHRAFRVCEYKCARRARLIGPSNYATIETTNTLPTLNNNLIFGIVRRTVLNQRKLFVFKYLNHRHSNFDSTTGHRMERIAPPPRPL